MSKFPMKTFIRKEAPKSFYAAAKTAEYLSAEKEKELVNRVASGDQKALDQLVYSHVRMVMSFVYKKFQKCGHDLNDIISVGMIGLTTAARRFDPSMQNRFATYAMWWVRAEINEYLIQNSSIVRVSNTTKSRSLFFNISRLVAELERKGMSHSEIMSEIADNHDLTRDQLEFLLAARSPARELDAPLGAGEDRDLTFKDVLRDDAPTAEEVLIYNDELDKNIAKLNSVIAQLNEREQSIFRARRLADDPETLEVLGQRYSISRERIRQIEEKAAKKVYAGMMASI